MAGAMIVLALFGPMALMMLFLNSHVRVNVGVKK